MYHGVFSPDHDPLLAFMRAWGYTLANFSFGAFYAS